MSEESFSSFCETSLRPMLKTFEVRRKGILNKLMLVVGVVVVLGGLGAWFALRSGAVPVSFIIGIVALIAIALSWWFLTKDYVREYKTNIVGGILRFVSEDLRYDPDNYIGRGTFEQSRLFLKGIDRYKGEDYISGKVDKTDLEMSELHAEYRTTTTDSKGRCQTQWHTIFKGLFFVADFNKHFKGTTVVLPDTAEKLFGGLGGFFQKMNLARGELIKLEDPEFERAFVVYGDDQIEARYILSTALMRRILEFKHKTNASVFVSFVASKVFVAVSIRRNLFEPKLFSSALDTRMLETYLHDIKLFTGIVEDLNLNTRIWTKA